MQGFPWNRFLENGYTVSYLTYAVLLQYTVYGNRIVRYVRCGIYFSVNPTVPRYLSFQE